MQEFCKTVKTSSRRMLAACCNVLQLVCVKAVRGPVTSYEYGTGSAQSQFLLSLLSAQTSDDIQKQNCEMILNLSSVNVNNNATINL